MARSGYLLEEHQGGRRATDRARRVGADVRGRGTLTTHSRPHGPSGARSAVRVCLAVYVLGELAGYRYYPSPVPTRSHTHCRYTLPTHHPESGN